MKVPETMRKQVRILLNSLASAGNGSRSLSTLAAIQRESTCPESQYVIFSVDFYKGLWENLKKARLMRNKRNS